MSSPTSILWILTGPSGTGKTTLSKNLEKLGLAQVLVSHTTREPRRGEVEGEDYYFIPRERFEAWEEQGAFVEAVTYNGNRYGMTYAELDAKLSQGDAVVVVEAEGVRHLMAHYEDRAVVVYLMPPSLEDLAERLLRRGDPEDKVVERLQLVTKELASWPEADVVLPTFDEVQTVNQMAEMMASRISNCDTQWMAYPGGGILNTWGVFCSQSHKLMWPFNKLFNFRFVRRLLGGNWERWMKSGGTTQWVFVSQLSIGPLMRMCEFGRFLIDVEAHPFCPWTRFRLASVPDAQLRKLEQA